MAYKDSVGSDRQLDGVFVLMDGSGRHFFSCGWHGPTEIRIYPCPNQQGGAFPARLSSEWCDFSDFVIAKEAVRYFGQHRKLTFITAVPGQADTDESPTARLFRVIDKAVQNNIHPEWREYTEGRNSHFTRPSKCGFLQGYLQTHNGKPVNPKMAPYVVLLLQKSARESFERTYFEKNPAYQHPGDPSAVDLTQYFAHPDPVDPQTGHIVRIMPRDRSQSNFQQYSQGPQQGNYGGGQQQQQQQFSGYAVEIGPVAPLPPHAMGMFKPWDQVLRTFSIGDQMNLLKSAVPPHIMEYAFQGTGLMPTNASYSYPPVAGGVPDGTGPAGPGPSYPSPTPETPSRSQAPQQAGPSGQAPVQSPTYGPSAGVEQPVQQPSQQFPPQTAPQSSQPQQGPAQSPVSLDFPPDETGQPANAQGQTNVNPVAPEAEQAKAKLEGLQQHFSQGSGPAQ